MPPQVGSHLVHGCMELAHFFWLQRDDVPFPHRLSLASQEDPEDFFESFLTFSLHRIIDSDIDPMRNK